MEIPWKYLWATGVLIILVTARTSGQLSLKDAERGGQWLSWGEAERAAYVEGFISGSLQGSHQACDLADQLFATAKTYHLGDDKRPSDMPSARCLARTVTYSRMFFNNDANLELSAYTDVITEFYMKHPEYDGILFPSLLEMLSDKKSKTASELYEMALKGELRPVR